MQRVANARAVQTLDQAVRAFQVLLHRRELPVGEGGFGLQQQSAESLTLLGADGFGDAHRRCRRGRDLCRCRLRRDGQRLGPARAHLLRAAQRRGQRLAERGSHRRVDARVEQRLRRRARVREDVCIARRPRQRTGPLQLGQRGLGLREPLLHRALLFAVRVQRGVQAFAQLGKFLHLARLERRGVEGLPGAVERDQPVRGNRRFQRQRPRGVEQGRCVRARFALLQRSVQALLGGAVHAPVRVAQLALGLLQRVFAHQRLDRGELDLDHRCIHRDAQQRRVVAQCRLQARRPRSARLFELLGFRFGLLLRRRPGLHGCAARGLRRGMSCRGGRGGAGSLEKPIHHGWEPLSGRRWELQDGAARSRPVRDSRCTCGSRSG